MSICSGSGKHSKIISRDENTLHLALDEGSRLKYALIVSRDTNTRISVAESIAEVGVVPVLIADPAEGALLLRGASLTDFSAAYLDLEAGGAAVVPLLPFAREAHSSLGVPLLVSYWCVDGAQRH